MGKGKGRKIQRVLSAKEAAALLRSIADELEGPHEGPWGEEAFVDIQRLRKLRIGFKRDREDGQISVKVRVRHFSEAEEPLAHAPEASPSGGPAVNEDFKGLKNKMKSSFKEIFKSLANGSFPSEGAVESFLEDSRKMVAYPGRGEEHYDEFQRLCEGLRGAFEKRELAACQGFCHDLNRIKTECHSDHK